MIPGEKPSHLKLWFDLKTGTVLRNELIYFSERKKKKSGRPRKEEVMV